MMLEMRDVATQLSPFVMLVSLALLALASVLLEASQAKADEFVDFCGLGGAIDTATPGACATSRRYPGQHGTKDRRTTFDSEQHVLRGDYAKIPGLRGQRACWELFREELGRLAAVDERPFASSRLNDENWLGLGRAGRRLEDARWQLEQGVSQPRRNKKFFS